jgi:hypothetical protein
MLTLSPGARFIIGVIITTAIGISTGAVQLAHAIPAPWIPVAVAWCGVIAFVGSAAQTGLQGLGMSNANKVAAAQTLPADQKVALAASAPEVQQIVTTREIAQAAGPIGDGAKVVSKPS